MCIAVFSRTEFDDDIFCISKSSKTAFKIGFSLRIAISICVWVSEICNWILMIEKIGVFKVLDPQNIFVYTCRTKSKKKITIFVLLRRTEVKQLKMEKKKDLKSSHKNEKVMIYSL